MSLKILLPLALLLSISQAVPLSAQEPKAKTKKKAADNPAYTQIKDIPGLPRVLLIGDSISIGYTLAVRKELAGQANVHRPATNCGPTIRALESLDTWLGEGKWDVIHFNFGLHDVRLIDGKQQVSPEDYEKNLETIVARLQKTGAKLIFATTTPIPAGAASRTVGDEVKYNDIARRVMEKHSIPLDDLHTFALTKSAEIQLPANVHFTPSGSAVLAQQVATSILANLPKAK